MIEAKKRRSGRQTQIPTNFSIEPQASQYEAHQVGVDSLCIVQTVVADDSRSSVHLVTDFCESSLSGI